MPAAGRSEGRGGSRVLTADEIARALRRVAHEIVERNRGVEGLIVVGIHTRGVPLAARLAGLLAEIEGAEVPAGRLDVALYRDDYARVGPRALGHTDLPGELAEATVVLVDDVLYTGRTIRAALDALTDYGRPRSVQLAALVDRGHRELPIRADYVGKNLPTAPEASVQVRVAELDGADEVVLDEQPAQTAGEAGA